MSDDSKGLSFFVPPPSGSARNFSNVTMVSLEPTNPAGSDPAPQKPGIFSYGSNSFVSNIKNSLSVNPSSSRDLQPGMLDGGYPSSVFEEEQSFIQKGINAAKQGANKLVGGAQSIVSGLDDSPAVLSTHKMLYFGVLAGIGVVFMLLAFLTLPLLVFAPAKFALLFTIGSFCFMASLALLKGVGPLVKHLFLWERLPFTAAYVGSLILTLYGTLVVHSYFLTLIFSIVQIVALVSFLVSYIPGGTTALKFFGNTALGMVKKVFKSDSSSGGSSLPI